MRTNKTISILVFGILLISMFSMPLVFAGKKGKCSSDSDCKKDYCDSWQNNYCKQGDVWRYRLCYDVQCNSGACVDVAYGNGRKKTECGEEVCKDGQCCDKDICLSTPADDGEVVKNHEFNFGWDPTKEMKNFKVSVSTTEDGKYKKIGKSKDLAEKSIERKNGRS